MKLRIVEPGWDNYTGDFGGVDFVDGISTSAVTPRQAASLAGLIRVETLEGTNPSSAQTLLDSIHTPMPLMGDLPPGTPPGEGEGTTAVVNAFTRKQLQDIADAKGIEGLRAVALPGVTSRSINGLIEAILNNQGGEPKAGKTISQTLYGSSVQPSTFEIDGKTIQLGSVVAAAFTEFEKEDKSEDDWNALPAPEREKLIADQLALMKAT